jgi:hypothetical protein
MVAPCAGSLAAAFLLVGPIQVNLLGYTGSNGFLRELRSLAKTILTRPAGCTLEEKLERQLMLNLFLEYKTLRDPIRRRGGHGPLTLVDDEDPTEVLVKAEVLSLEATAGLQVHPLSSPRLVLWQQLKEWLVAPLWLMVPLRGDGCAVASAEIP